MLLSESSIRSFITRWIKPSSEWPVDEIRLRDIRDSLFGRSLEIKPLSVCDGRSGFGGFVGRVVLQISRRLVTIAVVIVGAVLR